VLAFCKARSIIKHLLGSLAISTTLLSGSVLAEQLEVNLMLGQMYSLDLIAATGSHIDVDSASHIDVDSASHIAVGIAWQESPNGQGQILLNHVSHNFSGEDKIKYSLNIIYAHFNGIALFRQQNYTTTMSLGF